MPFPSALSTAQQTAKRSGIYSAIRYVAVNTPTVQLQFNPSVAANGQAAAQISFSTTLQGATANVLRGMTVYITPTSDYKSDLVNQPENCLKTYIRKAPTSALLYIGWTAFQWTTASYVTVVSNFEPHLKKTRIAGTVIYKDVDVTYRAPLPRLYGWYHHVIVTNTSTVNYSPTVTEEAMASGGSISSRTWATIISGTVTTGVSTSLTPTFNLSLGVHWLHLTTTDSNGNENWIAIMVAVVPDNFASVVTELVASTVTNSLNSGIVADLTSSSDISDIVPGSAALIFDDIVYRGAWREQVVKAFGWLDAATEHETTGDTQSGIRTEYRTQLLGIRSVAETLRISAFPFKYNASPATWGQVARCTVYDAIWYALSEHSTIASLASIDFPSSYTNYQYNPGIQIPEGAILDSVDTLAFFASGGMVNYSPNGELYFRQSLLYATSGRDSATVYATYAAQDGLAQRITHPPMNRFPLSAIRAGFATFNTTTNRPNVYQSLAPAEATPTALQETLDGIIMTKNLSNSAANTEAGKLAINHFFASVEAAGASGEFIAGYSTLVPSCFQWHKFDIPVGDTLDGSYLDSNTRFLCTQVNSNYDKDSWGIANSADFREETDGGSNYARETDWVPLETNVTYPTYPPGSYSVYLGDFDTPSDFYGTGFDDQRGGWEDPTVDPETAAENANPAAGVSETLYIPLTGGVVSTSAATTLGASYLIRVSNAGYIAQATAAGEWCYEWDFTQSDGGFTIYTVFGDPVGQWVDGTGWQYTDEAFGAFQYRAVTLKTNTFASIASNITQWLFMFDYTFGHFDVGGVDPNTANGVTMYNSNNGVLYTSTVTETQAPAFGGTNVIHTYEGLKSQTGTFFWFQWYSSNDDQTPVTVDGNVVIKRLQLQGTGTMPEFTGGELCGDIVYADALYYSQDNWETVDKHPNGSFLYLDGNPISNSLDFNSSHVYELTVTGTGGLLDFSFTDGYDSDYANNSPTTALKVEIIPL